MMYLTADEAYQIGKNKYGVLTEDVKLKVIALIAQRAEKGEIYVSINNLNAPMHLHEPLSSWLEGLGYRISKQYGSLHINWDKNA